MLAELQGRLPIRVELKGLTCAPPLPLNCCSDPRLYVLVTTCTTSLAVCLDFHNVSKIMPHFVCLTRRWWVRVHCVRVETAHLTLGLTTGGAARHRRKDFERILTETEPASNMLRQQEALLATEGVQLRVRLPPHSPPFPFNPCTCGGQYWCYGPEQHL